MSEGYNSALWHGIPIGEARAGYFIDALNTFHSMRKLRVNNKELSFASQNDGYVKLDGGYLNWLFGCPMGAFDPSQFDDKTIGQFFDLVINYSTNNYVKSWEEFVDFIRPKASTVNEIFSVISSASVSAPRMTGSIPISSIPTLPSLSDFAALMTWIKSILPAEMLAMQASVMQADDDGGQYSFGVTMEFTTTVQNMENAAMTFTFVI